MQTRRGYIFTQEEHKIIKERIKGLISEQECADGLEINRQRVDSAIAHWVTSMVFNGKIKI